MSHCIDSCTRFLVFSDKEGRANRPLPCPPFSEAVALLSISQVLESCRKFHLCFFRRVDVAGAVGKSFHSLAINQLCVETISENAGGKTMTITCGRKTRGDTKTLLECPGSISWVTQPVSVFTLMRKIERMCSLPTGAPLLWAVTEGGSFPIPVPSVYPEMLTFLN